MHRLREMLGKEHPLDTVSRAVRDVARAWHAPAVGALHVTCSDECERECTESFQQWCAQDLLPDLKYGSKSPFRSANLGGRYEWGAIPIAEQHFALPATRDAFKLLIVKINAHVCVHKRGGRAHYGKMPRYEIESTYCGAIHAMFDGATIPAVRDLRETFLSEGRDRVALLNDPHVVHPPWKILAAAVVNARLQARRAVLDIQNYRPVSPTCYLILPCVTLNRSQRDTELIVGMYAADHRERDLEAKYVGLGDDPGRYAVHEHHGLLQIRDDQFHEEREARDHRELVGRVWRQFEQPPLRDPAKRDEVVRLAVQGKQKGPAVSQELLAALLGVLAIAAPIPTAIELFVCGACGIHHVYQAYRLAHGTGSEHDARAILDDALARLDRLPPAEAQRLVETLADRYAGGA